MSKEEIKAKLEKLQSQAFNIAMIDHWTGEDFCLMNKINREMVELEKQLKEMEDAV